LGCGRWNGPGDARDGAFPVTSGEHAAIGLGDVHRIENPGSDELVFIEVQHGERLDENDIERIEDDYGRQ
jgi:mannose-6-phosphate isomerase